MTTLLAGLVELDVASAKEGGGRHQGIVQLELELVGTPAWLGVVGDVRLVRLSSSADVGRAQDLSAVTPVPLTRIPLPWSMYIRCPQKPFFTPPATAKFALALGSDGETIHPPPVTKSVGAAPQAGGCDGAVGHVMSACA